MASKGGMYEVILLHGKATKRTFSVVIPPKNAQQYQKILVDV
jgi:hypothetical protein